MIKAFDPDLVKGSVTIQPRGYKKEPNNKYIYMLEIEYCGADESYIYGSPAKLAWFDRADGKMKRYGFIPYPKYLWRIA